MMIKALYLNTFTDTFWTVSIAHGLRGERLANILATAHTVSHSQHLPVSVPKLNAELTLELTENLIRGHGLAGLVAVDDGRLLVHFLEGAGE